jgi:hypothetical protein
MVRLPGMPEFKREVIATDPLKDTVTIKTGPCLHCGKTGEVTMPSHAWELYADGRGEHIQRAWPEGSPGDREQLINGTHDACFNEMFPPEEE